MKTMILATKNQGKLKEVAHLLNPLGYEVKSLFDFPDFPEIIEDGDSFEANALIKARAVHQKFNVPVLADDSGLECDDLQGAPGIYSARFSGEGATDESNNQKLISEIQKIHDPSRAARYVCVFAYIDESGAEFTFRDTCEGVITFVPSGDGGFGYDPYFYLPDFKCTMAEISMDQKNEISHRGKALRKFLAHLK